MRGGLFLILTTRRRRQTCLVSRVTQLVVVAVACIPCGVAGRVESGKAFHQGFERDAPEIRAHDGQDQVPGVCVVHKDIVHHVNFGCYLVSGVNGPCARIKLVYHE